MFQLPIAERELRIGARARSTYHSRWNIAAIALGTFFVLYWNFGNAGPWAVTKIFFLLSNLGFLYALFAGLILASDCISSEKRSGTLGLLFLTALKPRELVLGNIFASSLKAFCGLFAAFPILGISLILGGIEYSEFVRICLALLSALIFSLSFSLFVSCLSQKYLVATGRSVFGLILFVFVFPAVYTTVRSVTLAPPPGWLTTLCLFSPVTTLHHASVGWPFRSNTFWWSFLAVNSLSSVFLLASCFVLPRIWQDRGGSFSRSGLRLPFLCGSIQRNNVRGNPYHWLASRRSHEAAKFLLIALLLAILAVVLSRFNFSAFVGRNYIEFAIPLFVWSWLLAALHVVLLYKVATLATSRLSEDRKLGALELILVTPVSVRQLLWGHSLALVRQLGGAMLGTLFIHGLIFWAFLVFSGMEEEIRGGAWPVLQRLTHALRTDPSDLWHVSLVCAIIVFSAVALCLDWIALSWAGTWIAIRTRRSTFAPWLTLALVLLPPVIVFALILSAGARLGLPVGDGFYWAWFCIISGFILTALHSLLVAAWCSFQVARYFRTFASEPQKSVHLSHVTTPLAYACSAIALLIFAFYGEERWRGRRAWNQLAQQYAAKGQPLLTRVPAPPPIPDAENFAAGETFKPLFDYEYDRFGQIRWHDKAARQDLMTLTVTGEERYPWRRNTNEPAANWSLAKATDLVAWHRFFRTNDNFSSLCTTGSPAAAVLRALSVYDNELGEIEKLSRRLACRFPLHYDEGAAAAWPHLTVLANLTDLLELRAAAKLDLGDIPAARSDVLFIFRVAEAVATGPGLYSFRIRQIILFDALQVIWEGLAHHAWSDDDLQFFEQKLRIDVFGAYPKALRENIIGTVDFWERFALPDESFLLRVGPFSGSMVAARLYPSGWKFLSQTRLYRLCDDSLLPVLDAANHRAYPSKTLGLLPAIRSARVAFDPVSFTMIPYWYQEFQNAVIETAHCQASLDQALIACRLEQWRETHARYPDDLDSFTLPRDVITGQPYKYRLLSEDRFVLYSVGWNEIDDAGKISLLDNDKSAQNLGLGDWTWQYPNP